MGTKRILDLSRYRVAVGQVRAPYPDFNELVRAAIRNGLYRPADELYSEPSVLDLEQWQRSSG